MSPNGLIGVSYNEEAEDLECEIISIELKRCKIPKEHFKGKKSGYYFVMHKNHFNKKTINYEVPPIQVIIDESIEPTDTTIFPSDSTIQSDDSKGNNISSSLSLLNCLLSLILAII